MATGSDVITTTSTNKHIIARIFNHNLFHESLKTSSLQSLSNSILSGHIGTVGEFPINTVAEIVYKSLKSTSTSLHTRVAYAFLLSSTQQKDAISTLKLAIGDETNTLILSQLYSFMGWVLSSIDQNVESCSAFQQALKLDCTNSQADFLRLTMRVKLMQTECRTGDSEFASENIRCIERYIERYGTLDQVKVGRVDIDGSLIHAIILYIECWFRRGPRGGVLIEDMVIVMKEWSEAVDVLLGLLKVEWLGILQDVEIETLEAARGATSRMIKMVEGVHNKSIQL